jgi:N6-adenosine-specific RNA methylase IME4
MSRCKEFYQKWERDPNWCEKCRTSVRQINKYIDLLDELESRGISKDVTIVSLPEGVARPLISIQDDDVRANAISSVQKAIESQKNPITGQFSQKLSMGEVNTIIQKARGCEIVKPQEIPLTNKYKVIYADPPWEYGGSMNTTYGTADKHYPTMPLQNICMMPVPDITEDNAVLFLWTTSPCLEDAFKVINAWEFKYKASFVWDKIKHVMGHYNSVRHEFLLVATKGSCTPEVMKLFDSVVSEERTEHSAKPESFRRIIDTIYPSGKRIELFARIKIEGWDSYGNQL